MAFLTKTLSVDLLIITAIILLIAYLLMMKNYQYWKDRGVFQIDPIPIFGNFAKCSFMRISPGYFLKELYEKSEGLPYMGFYLINKPCLLLRDPELIKQILVKDFSTFADKYMQSGRDDHLGNFNLFLVRNPGWKILRHKLSPIFTSIKLKNMFELMTEVGRDLDSYMDSLKLHGLGKSVEIKDLCAKFTTDAIGTTAYGLKMNSLTDPDAEFRKLGKKIFTYDLSRAIELTSVFFVPHLAWLINSKLFRQGSDFLRKSFWETMNERVKSGIKRNDLIDLLIDIKKSFGDNEVVNGLKFEGDLMFAQASVFFTAGFETSSTTMSFAFYELSNHPDVQEKLRSEINSAIADNDGKITYDLVINLPYLDMVVSETLRMYPILSMIDRMAVENYRIPNSNLVIEKGTPLFIPLLGLHYDSKYYSDPDVFDPERFSKENKQSLNPHVYMPFGAGPRNCIGMRLGLLQVKLGIIHIISRFELTLCKESSIEIDPKAIFTTTKKELILNVRKVDS